MRYDEFIDLVRLAVTARATTLTTEIADIQKDKRRRGWTGRNAIERREAELKRLTAILGAL